MPFFVRVSDNMILPEGYCHISIGQEYFRNAHHYFYMVTKNV